LLPLRQSTWAWQEWKAASTGFCILFLEEGLVGMGQKVEIGHFRGASNWKECVKYYSQE
jgi:hypothetical protein